MIKDRDLKFISLFIHKMGQHRFLLLNKFIKSRQRLNLFNNNNLVHSSGPAHCRINNVIIKDAR